MGLIAVIDTSEHFLGEVAQLVAAVEGAQVQDANAKSLLAPDATEPYVVVVGPSTDVEVGLELARRSRDNASRTATVIVAHQVSHDLMRRALKAGVSDVLEVGGPAVEVGQAVIDAYRGAEAFTEAQDASAPSTAREGGRIVTIFSMKGGVGKTVLATNLAAALADRFDLNVAIIDLDLQFGDVGIMLGLTPERTITDAVARGDKLDADYMRGCMTAHSAGFHALLAPTRPEEADNVTTGRISKILELLRSLYDVVVIDTAATFDEVVLTALDRSDEVYGVTMMDVASIKNTRISLQKLNQLGYADGLVRLVLNRADSKVWLQPAEVEKAIGAELFAKIPSDRIVPRSVNKGTPVVLDEPRSDVSKAMVDIAQGIAHSAEEVESHVA